MKIYRDINQFDVENPILTIGSFDGVHQGHLKIIDRLKEIAREKKGESVIFTFYPHPRLVLFPEEGNLRLLTTLNEKIRLFERAGIDHLIIFPFTKEFSQLTYTEFVKNILVDTLHIQTLVVGYDHKFGKNREGSFEMLQDLSQELNFQLEKLDVLLIDDINISSTKVRNSLQEGNVQRANRYLGYSYTLHGTVVEGQKLGRKIQFPTANVQASDPYKLIPGHGVYAVFVQVADSRFRGMLNIGTRPTVNQNADNRSIEVHILGFDGNLYGREIELEFVEKIRDEQKFASVDDLRLQLEKDKQTVLSRLPAL
ncbi:bifunctional riboflavin kinase/FAD synthetase [Mangrovibacterium marinum]|uniref:Riboflavin biosynthesis protein n=1 Tax=Mangrovibacterium marinum TaxID=1639118 RepID=A0A2T5BYD0_9BACT|nr:bifunctional riboflavin kinase/FAD synthetase [Mangrovibacterium marinum]PTN07249.1 riboflavin kinase/FMN adenylyltransferase [Mangrovibacterium marinum]